MLFMAARTAPFPAKTAAFWTITDGDCTTEDCCCCGDGWLLLKLLLVRILYGVRGTCGSSWRDDDDSIIVLKTNVERWNDANEPIKMRNRRLARYTVTNKHTHGIFVLWNPLQSSLSGSAHCTLGSIGQHPAVAERQLQLIVVDSPWLWERRRGLSARAYEKEKLTKK